MIKEKVLKFKYGYRILGNNERLVTSISVDNFKHTMRFVIEKGINVDAIEITVEAAEESGLLNLDKLNQFFKKQIFE